MRRISFNTVRQKQPRTKEHLIEAMHRLNHLAEEELASLLAVQSGRVFCGPKTNVA